MLWSKENVPFNLKNKPDHILDKGIQAANKALLKGLSEAEATFACTQVIKALEQRLKPSVAPLRKVPEHVKALSNLRTEVTKVNTPDSSLGTNQDLLDVVSRLERDITELKSQALGNTSSVVNVHGRSNILDMQDMDASALQTGSTIIWDAALGKFKTTAPIDTLLANLENGIQGQVLVKNSSSTYDYKWEDMIIDNQSYTRLIDRVSDTLMYIGEALPGTITSTAQWRIKRVQQLATNTTVIWADNVYTFTKVWDNRAIYTYDAAI
jgi:hypothetical protein